jgi:hypothetical protein
MTIQARDCSAVTWPPEDDAELVAMDKKYRVEHELRQLDVELGLSEPETGRGLLAAAELDLKERGIHPANATEKEMAEALIRVSP